MSLWFIWLIDWTGKSIASQIHIHSGVEGLGNFISLVIILSKTIIFIIYGYFSSLNYFIKKRHDADIKHTNMIMKSNKQQEERQLELQSTAMQFVQTLQLFRCEMMHPIAGLSGDQYSTFGDLQIAQIIKAT